jgi:hypothetical protein
MAACRAELGSTQACDQLRPRDLGGRPRGRSRLTALLQTALATDMDVRMKDSTVNVNDRPVLRFTAAFRGGSVAEFAIPG